MGGRIDRQERRSIMRHRRIGPVVALAVLGTMGARAAEEPLRERIDRAIEAKAGGKLAAPATDGEFLRRAALDLTGMIPTADEARAFLDDPSPYKRERLIGRLLDGPEFARRMQVVFDVMLMERRRDQHVPAPQWQAFLLDAFDKDTPYNEIVRTILQADGADPSTRAAAKFYLERDGDPYLLTRDVGRLFLGRDMQCAQCHDHVLYDDYKQAHYHGLYAFFSRGYLVQDARGVMTFAEKGEGDVTFASVFKKKVTHATGPRLLDEPPVAEPAVAKGDEYIVHPHDKVRAIPRHSRREMLGPLLASGKVPEFNRNIVNRLWALMMGRGLVHPLDLHHGDNPPSHPEQLDLLAEQFVAMGYDVKAFLRELALTRAYARSSEPPPGMSPAEAAPERFAVAELKPLSPEQMAWSIMQATGQVSAARAEVERQKLDVDPKLRAILATDEPRRRLGRRLVEAEVHERLNKNVRPFVGRFGRAPGQAQEAADSTVHQALFLANGQPIQGWLAGLGSRLAPTSDASAVAEELYLAALTRRPTRDEREEVAQYLTERASERPKAVGEIAWALLTSAEFRFNH
jgi:hypothetical protein